MNTKTAYDLHEHGSGGFITFERNEERIAVQLLALDKATLKGAKGTLMVLEFSSRMIHVSGSGLSELFEHLLGGRVKIIREGRHAQCAVDAIILFEE